MLGDNAMAIVWCDHVDGKEIFPKLPVYLRAYHKIWERNVRVRDAVRRAERGHDALRVLNAVTLASAEAAAAAAAAPRAVAAVTHAAEPGAIGATADSLTTDDDGATARTNDPAACAESAAASATAEGAAAESAAVASALVSRLFAAIGLPQEMPRSPEGMVRPFGAFVGGTAVGGAPLPPAVPQKRKQGDRGKDHIPGARLARTCRRCKAERRYQAEQEQCAGAAPVPKKNGVFFCSRGNAV